MSDIKRMSIKEFVEKGFLQEANRLFFHPHGLALAVFVDDFDGTATLSGIWDYREDPEGMVFEDTTDPEWAEKMEQVKQERVRHLEHREALFGHFIQPIGSVVEVKPKEFKED